jgi:hypothetical protein
MNEQGNNHVGSERIQQTTSTVFFFDAFKTVVAIVNSMWCGDMFSSSGRK